MSDTPTVPGSPLPSGRFEGREAFRQMVRDVLARARMEGWRTMVFCDFDFADWPLGERAVVESLDAWAGGRRSLILLAGNYDAVARLHPRFVQWRVRWDHVVMARKTGVSNGLDMPSMLWTDTWAAHRLDPLRSVGVAVLERERLVRLREELDEWLQNRSAPGFPASVLGL